MEELPQERAGIRKSEFRNTTISLSLVIMGVVLVPMVASKAHDPNVSLGLWLISPILVTLGSFLYLAFYLRMTAACTLREVWREAVRNITESTRYIVVLIAIAYLVGFFFDPNGG